MTIIFYTNLSFPNGGMASGNRTLHFARNFHKAGCKVIVLSPFSDAGRAGVFVKDGIEFHAFCNNSSCYLLRQIKSILLFPFKALITLSQIYEKDKLIYSHTGNIFHDLFLCSFSYFLKVPICREGCEYPLTLLAKMPKLLQWLELNYVLKKMAGMVVISDALMQYFKKHTRNECDIIKIPMTVDCDRFCDIKEPIFDFDYIAYTGSMNRYGGGVDVLVKTFALLAKKFGKLHLVLIGRGTKKFESELLSMVEENVASRIHCLFSGAIPAEEMTQYINGAKILAMLPLQTKQQEGCFPTKLGEYLASGRPTVVSYVGNPRNVLADRENVFFVPQNDPNETAQVMSNILLKYDDALRVAERGKVFARSNYHYEIYGADLVRWAERVLANFSKDR